MKTSKMALLATALLAASIIFPASAASAAEEDSAPQGEVQAGGMWKGEIREDIAAANGYEVITQSDGSQVSVPVTEAAKEREAAATVEREAALAQAGPQPFDEVVGDCGSARVGAVKKAGDLLAVTTGYVVFGAVREHHWVVNAIGAITGNSLTFGGAPNAGIFSGEGGMTVIGPGIASVPLTSFAVLASGQVCYSYLPTAAFG